MVPVKIKSIHIVRIDGPPGLPIRERKAFSFAEARAILLESSENAPIHSEGIKHNVAFTWADQSRLGWLANVMHVSRANPNIDPSLHLMTLAKNYRADEDVTKGLDQGSLIARALSEQAAIAKRLSLGELAKDD